jgi:hypothetical protein
LEPIVAAQASGWTNEQTRDGNTLRRCQKDVQDVGEGRNEGRRQAGRCDSQDRYREMRAIRQHMAERRFERIPDEFRSMKRLWRGKGLDGLLARRDREASLFEAGLKQPAAPAPPPAPIPALKPPTSTVKRIG